MEFAQHVCNMMQYTRSLRNIFGARERGHGCWLGDQPEQSLSVTYVQAS